MLLSIPVQPLPFQSTHPVRGATLRDETVKAEIVHISIHAPREGCDRSGNPNLIYPGISIHAPREGCDSSYRLPAGRAIISIHAPREGCDWTASRSTHATAYFNPRTP